jgi:hypothetical protein
MIPELYRVLYRQLIVRPVQTHSFLHDGDAPDQAHMIPAETIYDIHKFKRTLMPTFPRADMCLHPGREDKTRSTTVKYWNNSCHL